MCTNDAKQEELEKVYKNCKIRTRMAAVRMVHVRNMLVNETADIHVRSQNRVCNRLRRYDLTMCIGNKILGADLSPYH